MSIKVQVILKQDEAAIFKAQAIKDSKSLSAWLRDAGKAMIEIQSKKEQLNTVEALKTFFHGRNRKEQGAEPSWDDHKSLISEGYQGRNKQ